MSEKWIYLLLFISNIVIAGNLDNYEKNLLELFKQHPNVFHHGSNILNEIKSLPIAEEKKSELTNCILTNRNEIYSIAYSPYFKKHLSIEELKSFANWLSSGIGKKWVVVISGKMSPNELTPDELNVMGQFNNGDIIKKLGLATGEAMKVAESAGAKLARICS